MVTSTLPKAKKHFSLGLVTGSGLQSNKHSNELFQNEIKLNDLYSEWHSIFCYTILKKNTEAWSADLKAGILESAYLSRQQDKLSWSFIIWCTTSISIIVIIFITKLVKGLIIIKIDKEMAKSKDTKKEVKKEAAKTPKEKKAEKKLKKPSYD